MLRTFWFAGWILLFAGWTSALDPQFVSAQEPLASIDTASQPAHDQLIQEGLALENKQLWADGVRHYEDAVRLHPDDATLRQRLVICRLHYDVHRRYQDASYLESVRELPTSQALDLYAEVLASLETNYVDSVNWSDILRHGTASLEVALTEPAFVSRLLSSASPEAIEHFRQNIHLRIAGRSATSRYDLRATASYVAGLAREELGLSATATVLEFTTGALSALDAYSRFLTGSQLDETFSNIEGNFVGLGVELKAAADKLMILSVIPGGPAEQAGLKGGEAIVQVEDAKTSEFSPDYVADLLRGPEQSLVSIKVLSAAGEARELQVVRRRVEVPCVDNVHLVDAASGIGYLRLTNFQRTTTRDVEKALWDLNRQGMKSLIIDVRGNPGGLLTAAVEVADRFLPNGRIVTTRGRNSRENFDYTAHRPNTWTIPLAVLIDSDSASASEIFAGAIHDHRRGTLIGETTYGKGSVQGIFRMQSAKFGLCLTTAKFYSPSGQAISDRGVIPDVVVAPTYISARPNPDSGQMTSDLDDSVLQKAMETIRGDARLSSRAR
ncbi:MAG: S41 family peptidase [Planctomycetaceae bacterium]